MLWKTIHRPRYCTNRDDHKEADAGRSRSYDAKSADTVRARLGRNPSGQGFANGLRRCEVLPWNHHALHLAPCIPFRKAAVASMYSSSEHPSRLRHAPQATDELSGRLPRRTDREDPTDDRAEQAGRLAAAEIPAQPYGAQRQGAL